MSSQTTQSPHGIPLRPHLPSDMSRHVDDTEPVSGVLVIDKPAGMTSHDVVSRVRRLLHTRKVGHAGTLDPMATGVLVLGIGKATRLLTYISGVSKTYEATMRLGVTTHSEDADGTVTEMKGCSVLDLDRLEEIISQLRGPIMQVPSKVSAIKVNGKRAHALVRAGEHVELAARPVTIHRLNIESSPRFSSLTVSSTSTDEVTVPVCDIDLSVDCSSGTYVRALARDIGEALGCGAHLISLRRTRVGVFTSQDAQPLANSHETTEESDLLLTPIRLEEAVARLFPVMSVNSEEATRLRHGNAPKRQGAALERVEKSSQGGPIGVICPEGTLIGLVRCVEGKLRTVLVF